MEHIWVNLGFNKYIVAISKNISKSRGLVDTNVIFSLYIDSRAQHCNPVRENIPGLCQ